MEGICLLGIVHRCGENPQGTGFKVDQYLPWQGIRIRYRRGMILLNSGMHG